MFLRRYILFFFTLLSFTLQAQQYPVDVQVFVTPPYPQSLRGYADTFEQKIQAHFLLKDLSTGGRPFVLRFSLEDFQGQVIAETPDYITPYLVNLSPGVRRTLTNIDFKTLLRYENLYGINEATYNGLLPEGTYFIGLSLYDVATGRPVSNKGRAMIQVRRYSPPVLTMPQKGEVLTKKNAFQHIVFQWMPRDVAPFMQYEFTLKEVWDLALVPEEAFMTGRLVYQTKTFSPALAYTNMMPILLENKRYVWQVRAFTNNPNNPNEQSYFKNNGNSETFYFDLVSHCEAPKFLTAITESTSAQLRWSAQAMMPNQEYPYKVMYREKGKTWKSQKVSMPYAKLTNLKRGRTYIYKVGVACGLETAYSSSVFGEESYMYSTEQEFTTTEQIDEKSQVQCGVKPEIRIKNTNPLQDNLYANTTFTAGDFPVTVLNATGNNGVYSGEGYVKVPYLQDTKIKVVFNGIKLNTERQLIDGKLVTTYDETERNVVEVSKEIKGLKEFAEELKREIAKKKEETIALFGEQDENFDKSLEEWAKEKEREYTETAKKESEINTSVAVEDNEVKQTESPSNLQKSKETTPENNKKGEVTYYIKHKNKKYYTGDKIKLPYKRNMLETFEMGDVADTTKVNFNIYYPNGGGLKTIVAGFEKKKTFFIEKHSEELLKLDIYAFAKVPDSIGVRIEIDKEVKKFDLTELKAIDLTNGNRVAKSGETLYYVNIPSIEKERRDTQFIAEIKPNIPKEEIPMSFINWTVNSKEFETNQGELQFKTSINEKQDKKITVKTGNPTQTNKSVQIKWVDGYNISAEVVSPPIQNALQKLSKYVNRIGSVLNKLDNTGKLEFNISFQGEEFLEEDEATRFYNIVRKGGFSGGINFVFKGFTYGADLKLAKAKIYLKPIIGLIANGQMQYEKRNDKKDFIEKDFTMNFGLQADLQVGGELGVDLGVVNIKASPYAGISSWGNIKYSNIDKSIEGEIGIGKPYVGITGEMILGGYNIIPSGDFKYIWDNIKYESSPFKIYVK